MAKQAVAAHAVDLEPIDRLEEKITRLVTMVAELRSRRNSSDERISRSPIISKPAMAEGRATGDGGGRRDRPPLTFSLSSYSIVPLGSFWHELAEACPHMPM